MTKRSPLKQAALEAGLKWYWPGKACKNGHLAEWHVSGGCRTCRQITAKQWQQDNPERAAEAAAKHRLTDKRKETLAVWVETNRDKLRVQYSEKEKRYRKQKTNRAISAALSCRLRTVLKGNPKVASITVLLGCTIVEFRGYIQKQWLPGMSWDNWTKDGWHIDHIKPCSSFDLSKEYEQRACFHYTNMQPLWAVDNLRKGNKLVS